MFRATRTVLALVFCVLMSLPLYGLSSSCRLIEDAYINDQVTDEERLVMLVQSVKDPAALPVQFQSSVVEPSKSATAILLEAWRNMDKFSLENQALLKSLMLRPSQAYNYNSPSGKFKIHYDLTGGNAVPTTDVDPANGIPDYIDWLADYADSCYREQVINLTHREPPSDYTYGGDSRYDIYTEQMDYYGYTQPEGYGPEPWDDAWSYISVHRNFYGFPPNDDPDGDQKGAMKVTVAHEYYHAVQCAYDYTELLWQMETSSVWMEDHVFDPVNDNYYYLPYFMSYPHYSLHYGQGLHPYGAFVWPTYLVENFGEQIMPEIWEELIYATPYEGTSTILGGYGTTLEDEFSNFTVWNYCTGSRDDGLHYIEGANYSLVPMMRTHSSFPISGQTPTSTYRPDGMGCNYIKFNYPGGTGHFDIDFNGDNSTPWQVKLITSYWNGGYTYGVQEMTLDINGDGTFRLNDPQNWDAVIMIIANVSQTLNNRVYTYGASFTPGSGYEAEIRALAEDSVYSNTSSAMFFEIENTGSLGDDFDLSTSDHLGWAGPVSPSITFLNPGEFDTAIVYITCPLMTLGGVSSMVSLFADPVSEIGSIFSDSALVTSFLQHADADNSGVIEISDGVYLVAYVFTSGLAPVPVVLAGDADCSDVVEISDAVFVIDYVFNSGPAPPCNPF